MRSRVLFFTWLAILATPGRFLPLFYQAHGLNEAQIGLVLAVSLLSSLVSTPPMSAKADQVKSKPRLIAQLQSLSALAFFAHLAAYPALNLIGGALRFPYILAFSAAYRALGQSVEPITTAICIEQLRALYGPDGHLKFGQERAWGAVSWAIMSQLIGFLLDMPGVEMWVIYPVFAGVTLLFIASLARFDAAAKSPDTYSPLGNARTGAVQDADVASDGWLPVFRAIFESGGPACALFFVLTFWLGAGTLIVERLMFLYFVNELGASNALCGLMVVLTVVFEVPLFGAAPSLLRHFGSANLMLVGALAYVFRVLVYAAAGSAWVVLAVEPLHGVTFACTQAAAVAYVAERTPDAMQGRAQGLLFTVTNAGAVLGLGLGGTVMQFFGARLLCVMSSFVLAVAGTAFAVVEKCGAGWRAPVRDDVM